MAFEQSWLSWVKFDSSELNVNIENQIQAVGWSLAMIAMGFIILAFDTRQPVHRRPTGFNLRDRIAGLEQRYFLILLNGFIFYAALTYFCQKEMKLWHRDETITSI